MGRRRAAARRWQIERAGEADAARFRAAPVSDDPVEQLVTRSRKSRAKGDVRRAVVLLRQACALDEWRARTWTLLGALLGDVGARDEALSAFKQARWLRARAGEAARAIATERLAARFAA